MRSITQNAARVVFGAAALVPLSHKNAGRLDTARRNLLHNRALEQAARRRGDFPALLNGQAVSAAALFRYGRARYGAAGCTVLALYNALALLGRPAPLAELGYRCEVSGGQMLLGAWGTDPYAVGPILAELGVPCARFDRLPDLAAAAEARGRAVLILSFWNVRGDPRAGVHTVAVQCDTERAWLYTAYNRFDDRASSVDFRSLDALLQNGPRTGSLIVGYLLG